VNPRRVIRDLLEAKNFPRGGTPPEVELEVEEGV